MKNIPSKLLSIVNSLKALMLRFPLMLSLTITSTVSAMLSLEVDDANSYIFFKLCMFCILGIPMSISVVLFTEANKWKQMYHILLQSFILAIIALYFLFSPNLSEFMPQDYITYFLLLFAALTSLTFTPFLGQNQTNALWQYNQRMITRAFFSGLFSIIIYLGISFALYSIDALLKFDIKPVGYLHTAILTFGLFATCFFAAGFSEHVWWLNRDIIYPKVLKFFTQYILLPLAGIYLLILYAYTLRIIILWQLPTGWVSSLIITLGALGLIIFIFTWPLIGKDKEGNEWAKFFVRYFFIAFSPLLILLFTAIGRRIADYGVTENRYLLLVIAIWLTASVLYLIFSKRKSFKFIPVSPVLIAILISFGSGGVSSVSQKSQIYRLEKLLEANNILMNDEINKEHPEIADSTAVEINQILDYLQRSKNAYTKLEKRWNTEFVQNSNRRINRFDVAKALNLKNMNISTLQSSSKYFYWHAGDSYSIDVEKYNHVVLSQYISPESRSNRTVSTKNGSYLVSIDKDNKYILIKLNDKIICKKSIEEYLNELTEKGWRYKPSNFEDKSQANLNFEMNCEGQHKFKFIVSALNGTHENGSNYKINSISFTLLIKD
jgi:hypothetical protein